MLPVLRVVRFAFDSLCRGGRCTRHPCFVLHTMFRGARDHCNRTALILCGVLLFCCAVGGGRYELGTRGSVADVISDDERASSFTVKARVRVLAGIASSLNYLHRSHKPPIFHRDVKSANVVLTRSMQAKLIDCGVARVLTEAQADRLERGGQTMLTMMGVTTHAIAGNGGIAAAAAAGGRGRGRKGAIVGTQGYMCPRYVMSQGRKFGARTEVFAFGVTMLEVLLGVRSQDVPGGLYDYFFQNFDESDSESDSDDDAESVRADDGDSGGGGWRHSRSLGVHALDKRAGKWNMQPTRGGDGSGDGGGGGGGGACELGERLLKLASSCVAEYRSRPKTMLPVLRELKDLERRFCAVTPEEVQLRVRCALTNGESAWTLT